MSTLKILEDKETLQEAFDKLKLRAKGEGTIPCKGLIFRLCRSAWSHEGEAVGFKSQFRFLKRKSCKGCEKCMWLWDDLHERICDWGNDGWGSDIEFGDRNNALYQLKVTSWSRDYESGIVDDYELGFVEYKDIEDD